MPLCQQIQYKVERFDWSKFGQDDSTSRVPIVITACGSDLEALNKIIDGYKQDKRKLDVSSVGEPKESQSSLAKLTAWFFRLAF